MSVSVLSRGISELAGSISGVSDIGDQKRRMKYNRNGLAKKATQTQTVAETDCQLPGCSAYCRSRMGSLGIFKIRKKFIIFSHCCFDFFNVTCVHLLVKRIRAKCLRIVGVSMHRYVLHSSNIPLKGHAHLIHFYVLFYFRKIREFLLIF